MAADTAQPVAADFEPLDMEELKLLPEQFKNNYMLLERLYGDKAWELVKAWAYKSADEQVMRVLQAPNWEQTVYARGLRDGFLEILKLEKSTAFQFRNIIRDVEQQKAEAEAAASAADEQANE